jgi:hypothetical protein
MNYVITVFKKQGESLYAIWIDTPDAEPQPGTVWQVVQTIEVSTKEPIPAALCGLLLMSEETSDRLFRQIADTWLGPVEDDLLDDFDQYSIRKESKTVLDRDYVDRLGNI